MNNTSMLKQQELSRPFWILFRIGLQHVLTLGLPISTCRSSLARKSISNLHAKHLKLCYSVSPITSMLDFVWDFTISTLVKTKRHLNIFGQCTKVIGTIPMCCTNTPRLLLALVLQKTAPKCLKKLLLSTQALFPQCIGLQPSINV